MPDNVISRRDVAEAKAHSRNREFFPAAIGEIQESFSPETIPIYVYNVGPLEHNEPRYPNHPHMLIRACPAAKEWILANSITHPFAENYRDENGTLLVRYVNGYREATKMLSPANPGVDQNFEEFTPMNVGGNLNNFGVFWSVHNPPLPQELAAAKDRLEKTFKRELAELAKIESGVGGTAEAQARANSISHAAANYFDLSFSWHRSDLVPKNARAGNVECPNCDEMISANAAVCRHCNAVLDEEKAKKLFPDRFKRGPGRPSKEDEAAA
jgi:hypothetical protein